MKLLRGKRGAKRDALKKSLSEKEIHELVGLVSKGKYHRDQVRELRDEIARRLGLSGAENDLDDLDEIENTFDYNDPVRGFNDLLKTLRIKRAPLLRSVKD